MIVWLSICFNSDRPPHHALLHLLQRIISLADTGDIAKAEELLNQIQADAISQNLADKLPDIDSYTAVINALIEEQRRLLSDIEVENDEIICDVNATMPNEHCAESNERGAVSIMALAEKAHDLLTRMEDLSGVSDHFSSMRLSGGLSTDLRIASLQPTAHHYDAVISAFANASTASHNARYTSHLTKNAPFIANRWLTRLETLSHLTSLESLSAVKPTVDSYYHVMEAYAASDTSADPGKRRNAPILVQSVFDKLKQNRNISPTVREYRFMLRTWCGNFGHNDGAYNATGLWMAMQRSFRAGVDDMEPTLVDGKIVLDAWARSA